MGNFRPIPYGLHIPIYSYRYCKMFLKDINHISWRKIHGEFPTDFLQITHTHRFPMNSIKLILKDIFFSSRFCKKKLPTADNSSGIRQFFLTNYHRQSVGNYRRNPENFSENCSWPISINFFLVISDQIFSIGNSVGNHFVFL